MSNSHHFKPLAERKGRDWTRTSTLKNENRFCEKTILQNLVYQALSSESANVPHYGMDFVHGFYGFHGSLFPFGVKFNNCTSTASANKRQSFMVCGTSSRVTFHLPAGDFIEHSSPFEKAFCGLQCSFPPRTKQSDMNQERISPFCCCCSDKQNHAQWRSLADREIIVYFYDRPSLLRSFAMLLVYSFYGSVLTGGLSVIERVVQGSNQD